MHPLCFFPTFYVFKEVICNKPPEAVGSFDRLASIPKSTQFAIGNYRQNFWTDNIASWKFWIPADIVIFSSPLWLRLPLMHSAGMLFTGMVSLMRGDNISQLLTEDKSNETDSPAK